MASNLPVVRPEIPPVYPVGQEKCFADGRSLRNIHASGKLVGSGSLRGDCEHCHLITEFERPAEASNGR